MTVTTIRPNGVHSGASNYTATGAASINAALADDTNTSYIRKTNAGTSSVIVAFDTTSIASNQIVRRVRLRGKVQTPTTDGKVNLYLGTLGYAYTTRAYGFTRSAPVEVNVFTPAVQIRGQQATAEFTGPWYTSTPDGSAWDQAAITAARIQVTDYRDSTDRAYVYELYVDVDKATQPTVTVSAPTGTITTTSTPDVGWTFSDTDGDAQTYYQVRVFDAATYGASTFAPGTSDALWESGRVASISTTTTVGTYLTNGTYRAYVRVAKTINGKPFWSDWAYSGFTISVTPPPTPTLGATWSEANGRVLLAATGAAPTGYSTQTFSIERSDDNGLTWATVRDAEALVPSTTYNASVYDYDAPRDQVVAYRVRSIGDTGTDIIASAYSTSTNVIISNDGKWWLKALGDPTLNMAGVRVLSGLSEEQQEDVGVFRPIGRTEALVVSGSLYGRDGSYRIAASGDSEWAQVLALVQHQGTLLVQDPFGAQKYVRIVSRKWSTEGAATAAYRILEVGYVEVAG